MTKAEERALEAYPVEIEQLVYQDLIDAFGGKTEVDINTFQRHMFQQGYEQAEKELELTWEDIERIEHYCEQVNREHNMGTFRGTPYEKSFYKEVARRFNAMKEEKE